MSYRKRPWLIILLVLTGVVYTCAGCKRTADVDLIPEHSQVWQRPQGEAEREVANNTKAGQGDQVWTQQHGRALLKWGDLWVRLYDDTDLVMEEITPSGVCLSQNAGTTLNGGVSKMREYVVKTGDHAEIKSVGTTFQVTYDPRTGFSVVRVFDGQAEVLNLTGEVRTETVGRDELALVEPGEPPQIYYDPDKWREVARELDLWDVFHEVELNVRDGFGPDESHVAPGDVDVVFEVSPTPTRTPMPTRTRTPTPTDTLTPTPTPTVTPLKCVTPMPGFGQIWTADADVRSGLGCPVESERVIWSAEETFIGGYMLWRQAPRLIYVLYIDDSTWLSLVDNWYEGTPEADPTITPPADRYQPKRGFGKVWRERADIRDRLGWATMEERGLNASWQAYEGGLVMSSDTLGLFVLYNDHTWSLHF